MLDVILAVNLRMVALKIRNIRVQMIYLLLLLWSSGSYAVGVKVAVSSNFTAAAKELAQLFESQQDAKVSLSFGSTGKLYAQISYGAPFDIFMSADADRPAKLVETGNAVKGTQFTYAIGKIALYSKTVPLADRTVEQLQSLLRSSDMAMANPKTAPYGVATQQALVKLEVTEPLQNKRIYGENIAQTYQFIETGNVKLGFVSLSQMIVNPHLSYWLVPQEYYQPLKQDAVLLQRGSENPDAKQFLHFLRSPQAQAIILRHGYGV